MKLITFMLRASWQIVLLATLAGSISGASSVGLIALIHAALRRPDPSVPTLAWAFAGLCVLVLTTQIASQLLSIRLSRGATKRLSQHLCERILDAPLRRLEEVGGHRLLATLTADVANITQAINGIPALCVSLVTLLCGMIYLGWLSPPLLCAMFVFMVLGVISYKVTSSRASHYMEIAREHRDTLMRHVRAMIEGTKELKIHHRRREVFLNEVLEQAHARVHEQQIIGSSIQAVAVTWGRLLFFVAIGLVLFVWPLLRPIDGPALTGYTLTILYLMAPLGQILSWLPTIMWASISLRKIETLGLSIGAGEGGERPVTPRVHWRHLEMIGVTHTYYREREGAGFRLGPIDLTLVPGELVFLVGGNGSGKTTLAKLLTGLYVPEEGEIRLDDEAVTAENREDYRQLFTATFAEAVLFESLLGLEGTELDERAHEHLTELHLDHAVTVRNGVFSTTDLSKGQRKRLALLTAYLEDRPIYVFDEWAADQDPIFKEVFYRRILPDLKARGKAILVITHDDRYFSEADRVITLADGEMVHGDWELAQSLAESGKARRRPPNAAKPASA
jgi:putative ATP-binding cassette transporter